MFACVISKLRKFINGFYSNTYGFTSYAKFDERVALSFIFLLPVIINYNLDHTQVVLKWYNEEKKIAPYNLSYYTAQLNE